MARELEATERARLLALETWLCDQASDRAGGATASARDTASNTANDSNSNSINDRNGNSNSNTNGNTNGNSNGNSNGNGNGNGNTISGLEPRDRAHLERLDPRRVRIYTKLVQATLSEAIRVELPLTSALGGAAFAEHVTEFLRVELPRSPILRDVAFELARFALPRLAKDARLPAFLGDLARYELFELEVCWAERGDVATAELQEELAGDSKVALDGTCRIARFDFAVHELADEPGRVPSPRREPTHLLGYRDAADAFRRMTLTPLAAALLVRLHHDREPLAVALVNACAVHGRALDQSVIDGAAAVLEELAARGALLGAHVGPTVGTESAPSAWQSWLCDPTGTLGGAGALDARRPGLDAQRKD